MQESKASAVTLYPKNTTARIFSSHPHNGAYEIVTNIPFLSSFFCENNYVLIYSISLFNITQVGFLVVLGVINLQCRRQSGNLSVRGEGQKRYLLYLQS